MSKCVNNTKNIIKSLQKAVDSMNAVIDSLETHGAEEQEPITDRETAERNALVFFDFDKVEKVMSMLDWRWARSGGSIVPTTDQAREEVKKIIDSAWKELDKSNRKYDEQTKKFYKEMTVSTGGFEVYVWENDRESWVDIRFILTENSGSSNDVLDDSCVKDSSDD